MKQQAWALDAIKDMSINVEKYVFPPIGYFICNGLLCSTLTNTTIRTLYSNTDLQSLHAVAKTSYITDMMNSNVGMWKRNMNH